MWKCLNKHKNNVGVKLKVKKFSETKIAREGFADNFHKLSVSLQVKRRKLNSTDRIFWSWRLEKMQEAEEIKKRKFMNEAMIKKTVSAVLFTAMLVGIGLGVKFGLF